MYSLPAEIATPGLGCHNGRVRFTSTQFVTVRGDDARQSRRPNDGPSSNEIATLRSQ